MMLATSITSRGDNTLSGASSVFGRLAGRVGLILIQGVVAMVLALGTGCQRASVENMIVVTQTPTAPVDGFFPVDILDSRYPPGSRVVVVDPVSDRPIRRVLSAGLFAAGGPVVAPDGDTVMFVARATADSLWQVYESPLARSKPVVRTTMPGGAMGPVYLPDGRFAFSSPVPRLGRDLVGPRFPELYAQHAGDEKAEQLTFGLAGASDATVLADGRILFVSGGSAFAAVTNQALFTINTDGTELTAYGGQHDGAARVRRPRETRDGRVLFLSSDLESVGGEGQIEQVLTGRPFSSRSQFSAVTGSKVRSVEPASADLVLMTAPSAAEVQTYAVFALPPDLATSGLREPWFDDPLWDEVEAIVARPGPRPMGRLSTVDESVDTGLILCLDANETGGSTVDEQVRASRIRFLTPSSEGTVEFLGEIPLQSDGSFLAEVPANTLLGLEALDDSGRVVRRLPPTFWVRPGENRACVGCHEPHGTCPDNRRPLAVKQPAVKLEQIATGLAQTLEPR